MARTADDRKKKRQRVSGSDSLAKDAKMHEESPASMKQDRSLRPRSKESPPEVAKRAHVDATNMPLSLQQQETTEKSEEKGVKVLPIMSGRHSGPHESSGPRKKAKHSPDVEDLRLFVGMLGGVLEDGWQVDAHRSYAGKLTKTFISPSNEKFRSRIEVAKHLGLEANLLKKGEITKANNEVIPMDHDEEAHVSKETGDLVSLQDKKGLKSSLRNHSYAKYSGQRKEHGSKSPNFHEKAAANTNNGLILASDASKAIVYAQKAPEESTITQRCQDALRSIISTDSFAALSNMLNRGSSSGSLESPLQLKALPLIAGSLDLQLIHVRLSNGVYGQTPELFSADIQQVWKNITAAGNELVSVAHALSEFSDKLYKQQILSLFQDGASKEISERKGLPLSTSQHGKQSFEDSGGSLDNSHIVQESQLVTPPEGTITMRRRLLEKGSPGLEKTPSTTQGSPQSLFKKAGVVPRSYKSKRRPKKVTKSKRLGVLKMKAADNTTPGVCKSCGLKQGKDCVVCRLCNAVFHTHCMDLPSDSLPDSEWCCPSCATKENATEEVNKSKDRKLLKTTGRTEVCEACKKEDVSLLLCDACEAAYHMNCLNPPIDSVPDESWYCPTCAEDQKKSMVSLEDAHPDGHNCPVCVRISKDSPPNENTSTEHAAPENPSSLEGPDHSSEHGAPKNVMELESPEASVENESPEPGFFLEKENACKVCGVESTKSAVSCAWCLKRFHLSCLRPALKRLPRKTWFCPSCLCRVCKVDADDDKILLCDICDEGYHTYCLNPPLSEKPEGAWFCPSCAKDAAPNSPRQTEVLKRKRKSTEPRRST